jgi:hypothetical protein
MAEQIQIYRYLDSDAALKTLVSGAFKVGKISNFNDPFEWQFGVNQTTHEDSQKIEFLRQSLRQQFDSKIGVLCFSKSIKDPVLWSLYAEKHHGVAFELRHAWMPKEILHMSYSNQRPQVDVQKIHKFAMANSWETEFVEYIKPIIARFIEQKSESWRFENECRLTVHVKNPNHCQEHNGIPYWPIPKNYLTRIILGFRCPLEETQVRKLLDMNGFEDTGVARAKMCSETYAILC